MANPEGPVTPLVTDAMKFQCTNCNGSKFYISTTLDDPNDVAQDTVFEALKISITGGSFQGLVVSCVQCGHQQVPIWYFFDVGGATAVGNVLQMTNLDTNRGTNAVADLLVGLYAIPMAGTDAGEYFIITTNDASAATEIILTVAPTDDDDGIWMITNILPFGVTAHV